MLMAIVWLWSEALSLAYIRPHRFLKSLFLSSLPPRHISQVQVCLPCEADKLFQELMDVSLSFSQAFTAWTDIAKSSRNHAGHSHERSLASYVVMTEFIPASAVHEYIQYPFYTSSAYADRVPTEQLSDVFADLPCQLNCVARGCKSIRAHLKSDQTPLGTPVLPDGGASSQESWTPPSRSYTTGDSFQSALHYRCTIAAQKPATRSQPDAP